MKIYHNNRCSKSRAGLKFLEDENIEVEVVNYLAETPFTVETLTALIAKTGLKPEELVRKHEDLFKSSYKNKALSDSEWIEVLVENPRLLHRPIVENGEKAIWAQPAEKVKDIL